MKVLVTGGTGIIGSLTGRALSGRGHDVVLLDARPNPDALAGAPETLELVRGDVLAVEQLEQATDGADVVVHLAYSLGADTNRSPGPATTLNVQGTVNVLEAARRCGAERVVLASSVAIYGSDSRYRPEELPLDESAATHLAPGMALYGAGKLYLEELARAYRETHGLLALGLRPSPVYGPGGVRGVSGWLAELVEGPVQGRAVTLDHGDARMSLVYVEDVAEQLVRLAELPQQALTDRWFFNTGGDATSVRELAEVVRRLLPEADITVRSDGRADLAGLPSQVSGAALAQLIGYERRFGPEQGLAAHVAAARARS